MNVDFKKEVEARKDDLLKDLMELLRINSERDDSKATEDAPLGPGPRDAMLKFLEFAERDGFKTKNVDNLAGYLEYGEGDEMLGIIGHMDVVPAGSGWDTDPYEPVIKDNKLYARGSSDDKGPSMAAYYGLKIIKDLNLPVSKRVRFIVGTDEETGWTGMNHYLEVEEKPDFGFSPDAEFPIINGEKGNMIANLHIPGANDGTYQLISFNAGLRPNMVPESAEAVIKVDADVDTFVKDFEDAMGTMPVSGEAEVAGDIVTLKVYGKAAHGANPQLGKNAATYLAHFLNQYDFNGAAKTYIQISDELLHDDPYAKHLKLEEHDEVMGDLTMNVGIFDFDMERDDNTINLNFRFPTGKDTDIIAKLEKAMADFEGVSVELVPGTHQPHYVPGDDPLVKTLLDVYHKHTGLPAHEQVIGGGTFGRLLERGVAYGAMFPDSEDTMHQANEYMPLDALFNSAVIYADAIYQLIK